MRAQGDSWKLKVLLLGGTEKFEAAAIRCRPEQGNGEKI
jgi:hypothetical protein